MPEDSVQVAGTPVSRDLHTKPRALCDKTKPEVSVQVSWEGFRLGLPEFIMIIMVIEDIYALLKLHILVIRIAQLGTAVGGTQGL